MCHSCDHEENKTPGEGTQLAEAPESPEQTAEITAESGTVVPEQTAPTEGETAIKQEPTAEGSSDTTTNEQQIVDPPANTVESTGKESVD